MSAMADLYQELDSCTYDELTTKYANGEIDWKTYRYFADRTPDYMAMAHDFEITEVQYVRQTN